MKNLKNLKLDEGDFFHVEVAESDYNDEIRLDVKDGPIKGYYLRVNITHNPCLKVEIAKHICEICKKPLSGIEIGTGTGLAHEDCYYSPAGKQLLFNKTQDIINDIINWKQ